MDKTRADEKQLEPIDKFAKELPELLINPKMSDAEILGRATRMLGHMVAIANQHLILCTANDHLVATYFLAKIGGKQVNLPQKPHAGIATKISDYIPFLMKKLPLETQKKINSIHSEEFKPGILNEILHVIPEYYLLLSGGGTRHEIADFIHTSHRLISSLIVEYNLLHKRHMKLKSNLTAFYVNDSDRPLGSNFRKHLPIAPKTVKDLHFQDGWK